MFFELESSHEPRVRWLFATLLVLAAFSIGIAGFSLAGFGPCTASNPAALLISGVLSACVIYFSLNVLSRKQRRFRLRTIPFYLCLALLILFTAIQLCLFLLS